MQQYQNSIVLDAQNRLVKLIDFIRCTSIHDKDLFALENEIKSIVDELKEVHEVKEL